MASSFALSRRLLRTCGEQETEGPRSESDKQMDEYQELQKPAPRHMILRAAEQQRWVHGLQVRDGALRRGQECRALSAVGFGGGGTGFRASLECRCELASHPQQLAEP